MLHFSGKLLLLKVFLFVSPRAFKVSKDFTEVGDYLTMFGLIVQLSKRLTWEIIVTICFLSPSNRAKQIVADQTAVVIKLMGRLC